MAYKDYFINERRDMIPFLPSQMAKTIEFGCGSGYFSGRIKKEHGLESWGVDMNPQAAKVASKILDRVIVGEAMKAIQDIPVDYFDCLICNDFLEHLSDPDLFLKEVQKILKPKAYIICSVPNVRSWGHFIQYFLKKDWKYIDEGILDRTHLRFFTKKSLIRMLNDASIEIEKIQGITPTNTILFNLTNILSFGFISDMRFLQYAVRGRFK